MVNVIALHTFMTEEGELINKGTKFSTPDNDELKIWLRRGLVEIIVNKKKNKKSR